MSNMNFTRRRMLRLAGVTAMATLGAACAGPGTQPPPTSAPGKPAGAAPTSPPLQAPAQTTGGSAVALGALMSVGGSGKALTGGLQKFNEQFKGRYEVKSEMIAIESLLDKEMAQFISGTPTYDVLSISSDWTAGVAHFLEPLDNYLSRDNVEFASKFGPKVRDAMTFDGNLVALPARLGVDILFYRKDALDELSLKPPTTAEEYRDAAKKLTKRDGTNVQRFGASFKAQSPSWTVGSFGHFLLGSGGRYITQDGKAPHPSLGSPLTVELLETIRGTIQDGSTPEVAAWTYDDNVVAFQQGRVAMSDEYSARALLVEDPQKSQAVGKMGYGMWMMQKLGPEEPTHYGSTWNLAIDKNSRNKDAAWQLIKYMTDRDAQKFMALEYANGPTIIELYDDPEYQKLDPAALAVKQVLQGPGWNAYYPVPQLPDLQKAAHEEIQSFYLGRQTSKQATDNMVRRFADALKS